MQSVQLKHKRWMTNMLYTITMSEIYETLQQRKEHCNTLIMLWSLCGQDWHAILSILCQSHLFLVSAIYLWSYF